MSKTKKIDSYEAAMKELQGIVSNIQEGEVSIDDLSASVKRAAELINYCKEKLRSTEEDIQKVVR